MAWIRLSDDYNDHPKFYNLTDGAFRLWHQGIGFCRKFKTDGLIPMGSLRGFKSYSPKRTRELMTPWREGERALWNDGDLGVTVHDYLQWNPSKDEENERRAESKERMRVLREGRHDRRQTTGVPPTSGSQDVCANNVQTTEPCSRNVLDGSSLIGSNKKEETDALDLRASAFIERYPQIYAKVRSGAAYRVKEARDFDAFVDLVSREPDDTRLDALCELFLHLKGRDVLNVPGTPGQFVYMFPECDRLMRENGR